MEERKTFHKFLVVIPRLSWAVSDRLGLGQTFLHVTFLQLPHVFCQFMYDYSVVLTVDIFFVWRACYFSLQVQSFLKYKLFQIHCSLCFALL